MPTAAMHSHYWQQDWQEAPVVAGSGSGGGYVPWQTTVILGSGLGACHWFWERLMGMVRRSTSDIRHR